MTAQAQADLLAGARWRWTAELYERAAKEGFFEPGPRVELLDGEVLTMSPMLPEHSAVLALLEEFAHQQLDRTRWAVRSQRPVRLADDWVPEPDLAIAVGMTADYRERHPGPGDVALVVEVSDTSLVRGRNIKIPAYAAARIPWAWLVSLPENTLTIYSEPSPGERRFRHEAVLRPGETATHLPTGLTVPVAGLF